MERFDVLITTDQQIRHQQNLANSKIAILVLSTTSWPRIRRQIELVTAALNAMTPGDYREVSFFQ
jgi:hypothetical protein